MAKTTLITFIFFLVLISSISSSYAYVVCGNLTEPGTSDKTGMGGATKTAQATQVRVDSLCDVKIISIHGNDGYAEIGNLRVCINDVSGIPSITAEQDCMVGSTINKVYTNWTSGWNNLTISGVTLTTGTNYSIIFNTSDTTSNSYGLTINYDGSYHSHSALNSFALPDASASWQNQFWEYFYILYGDITGAGGNFDLSIIDAYDNTSITNFNATIYNSTYSETLNTVNGSVSFSQSSGNFTINVSGQNYFFKQIFWHNASADLTASIFQSVLIANASLVGDVTAINSFGIKSPYQTNNTNNGTAILYLKAGTYYIIANTSGYINSAKSITITALETQNQEFKFGSSNFSVFAKDYFTNATITNFSVKLSSVNYTSTINVTTGHADFSLINGSYTVDLDAIDYAKDTANITISKTKQNTTFMLYLQNSVKASIIDEDTGDLITQTATVVFDGGGYYHSHSTSNGTVFVYGLSVGSLIKMTASSSGYSTRDFYVTLTSKSHRDVEMRLSNTSSSALRTFTTKTEDGINIANVLVEVSKYENGTYNSVGSYYTDFSGSTQIYLSSANDYRMVFTKSSYEIYTLSIRPTQTTYTIILTASPTIYLSFFDKISYTIKPEHTILIYANTSFNITVANTSGILEYFGLRSNYSNYYCKSPQANCKSNETSGNTAEIFVDLKSNVSSIIVVEFWIKADGYELYNFNYTYRMVTAYTVASNQSIKGMLERQREGYEAWARPLVAVAFSLIIVVGFAPYIPTVALPVIMMGSLIIFTITGYIPKIFMIVIGSVVVMLFLLWERI